MEIKDLNKVVGGTINNVQVPNVIGISYSTAREELSSIGLSIDCKYERSSKPKDIVIISDPLPGMSVPASSKVVLTLSSGNNK